MLVPYRKPIMPNASPNGSQWILVHIGYTRVGFALGIMISFDLFPVPANTNEISGGMFPLRTSRVKQHTHIEGILCQVYTHVMGLYLAE